MSIEAAIIIPARYGSTRFEGKPLAMLAGKPMLEHVYARANMAVTALKQSNLDVNVTIAVATDDDRIAAFCADKNMTYVMTSLACRTGSDRVLEAVTHLNTERSNSKQDLIDIVLNLQGDNPFASVDAIRLVLLDLMTHHDHQVATPVLPLSWTALDALRAQKVAAPFSGTTVTVNASGKALWFSKQIIPAMRKEDDLRAGDESLSPVTRHIGLYGYRLQALQKFVNLPEGVFEALEGLEQLRFLENDIDIYTCALAQDSMPPISGIDTASDLQAAETLIAAGKMTLPDFEA